MDSFSSLAHPTTLWPALKPKQNHIFRVQSPSTAHATMEHDKVGTRLHRTPVFDCVKWHSQLTAARPPCCLANLQRICIYPCYLNANKTVAEGRKVPKGKGARRGGAAAPPGCLCCPGPAALIPGWGCDSAGLIPCRLRQPRCHRDLGLHCARSEAACGGGGALLPWSVSLLDAMAPWHQPSAHPPAPHACRGSGIHATGSGLAGCVCS